MRQTARGSGILALSLPGQTSISRCWQYSAHIAILWLCFELGDQHTKNIRASVVALPSPATCFISHPLSQIWSTPSAPFTIPLSAKQSLRSSKHLWECPPGFHLSIHSIDGIKLMVLLVVGKSRVEVFEVEAVRKTTVPWGRHMNYPNSTHT